MSLHFQKPLQGVFSAQESQRVMLKTNIMKEEQKLGSKCIELKVAALNFVWIFDDKVLVDLKTIFAYCMLCSTFWGFS